MTKNAHRTLSMRVSAALALCCVAAPSFAGHTYVVKPGDSLYGIARANGVPVGAVQKVNGLKDGALIHEGQKLTIPAKQSSPAKGSSAKSVKSSNYGRATRDIEVWADNERIAVVKRGAKFVVLYRDEDQYKIRLADGREGRVLVDHVALSETRKPVTTSPRWTVSVGRLARRTYSSESHGDVVATALSFEGARYRRGGMSSRGFDCSGFVKYVYATKGIALPHSSSALYGCGTPVSREDLKPGDVVFFGGTYRHGISHVGVYVGSGKFIHASTSRRGVRVDDLDAVYYRRRYVGARRM